MTLSPGTRLGPYEIVAASGAGGWASWFGCPSAAGAVDGAGSTARGPARDCANLAVSELDELPAS